MPSFLFSFTLVNGPSKENEIPVEPLFAKYYSFYNSTFQRSYHLARWKMLGDSILTRSSIARKALEKKNPLVRHLPNGGYFR